MVGWGQLHAYTIQGPFPDVPKFLVALISSTDKETAVDITTYQQKNITHMSDTGIPLLSLGSVSAANELVSQFSLIQTAQTFLNFTNPVLEVDVNIPLLGTPPCPIVTVQDPKHAQKAAANQILYGAQLLSFGRFYVNIQQLASLLDHQPSPLVVWYVFDSDKQENGCVYCTFNSKTLEAALSSEHCQGLAMYLFVSGEMWSVWLKNSIG